MSAKMFGGVDAKRAILALCLAAAMTLPAQAQGSDPLNVVLDQATIMKLPEKVSTIVVGNPLIADVAVQSGGLIVVTGKGYGSTNVIALDRAGTVLMERSIMVSGPVGPIVQVYRGMERETYSCAPNCERRITLGDSANYFTATIGQAGVRDNQAVAAGARR
jgi:Flp pilus assembly secretin CpaC